MTLQQTRTGCLNCQNKELLETAGLFVWVSTRRRMGLFIWVLDMRERASYHIKLHCVSSKVWYVMMATSSFGLCQVLVLLPVLGFISGGFCCSKPKLAISIVQHLVHCFPCAIACWQKVLLCLVCCCPCLLVCQQP